MQMFDYETKTTFWDDFSIAEVFGKDAILETYARAFEEWKADFIYLTELVMVLNWKSWAWADSSEVYSQLYADLYYKADDYACKHLKGAELSYYYTTTD